MKELKKLIPPAVFSVAVLAFGCQPPPSSGDGGGGAAMSSMSSMSSMSADMMPDYHPDPSWPILPDDWLIGEVSGIAVDQHDNIWIVHRPRSLNADEAGLAQDPPLTQCCNPAPPVLKFDARGHLQDSWGGANGYPGEGYEWPASEHGIFVDHNDNVWVAGNGPDDHQVIKFSNDGTFLMQIGQAGMTEGSNSTRYLGQPADIEVDPETNEAYIADGYLNKRVVVFDADTGAYKRHWGAYGNPPSDEDTGRFDPAAEPIDQFRTPLHAVRIANDGLVYVADRVNNRIQVFQKDGTYVDELIVEGNTLGNGSTWDLELSPDMAQMHLFNADGANQRIHVIDRAGLAIVGHFGRRGRLSGQFHWVHNLVVDSMGNMYTAEVSQGRRAQKFVRYDDHDHTADGPGHEGHNH